MVESKEEVVISGIGGRFPDSDNLDELKELLFKKINGVKRNERQLNSSVGILKSTGKINDPDRFDNIFFKTHSKLAANTDPLTKCILEGSVEAIIDAGLSPSDLSGTNTSVFSYTSHSESEIYAANDTQYFTMVGCSKAMQANRVSYFLNLNGPSVCIDEGVVGCSSGLTRAKQMIEDGTISAALVGAASLSIRPELHYQFEGLNKLNNDNKTKSFDSNADGYNRSDACVVMLLQKASEAKRSYGTLLGIKSIQFGDHEKYLTEYSRPHFKSVLLDCYKEANIDPATVDFVEAYGSGIKCDDTMELNVLEEVFCTDQRKTPLKVGSVKSNVGHCGVASLFVSIAKAIIALDGGYIPPNIHYTTPNPHVAALKSGKIQVVTEKTPLCGDIIGISSFCNISAFSHVILKRNSKVKNSKIENGLPRLLLVSGRNEENVNSALKKIKSNGNDEEYVALTNDVFTRKINFHFFRSFSIFPSSDESRIDDVWNVTLKKRPIWFIFSGMGSQWQGMGTHLLKLPIFAEAINKCDSILKPRGVDIKNILTSLDPKLFDNILNSFVGIAAIQIGLVEVLRALDVNPDGMIGHSVGELGCAYADGCFTAEEMILSAYARGRASLETDLIPGMMAAIGLGYDQIKDKLPHDLDVACRNSASSCTISGPVDSINEFVTKLKSEGIFAKAVNAAGIAYHSRYIQAAGPTLLKYLKEVIKEPKLRSSKWISSSIPESKWDSDLAKYSSPEYHTNNLLNSVLFEDALKHIPNDAVTIEIAPHGLLQAILIGALPNTVTNIPLTKRVFGDSIKFLLTAIGKMYGNDIYPKIQGIYPKITFPVSRGTPSIHSLPFWDHRENWLSLPSTKLLKFTDEASERFIQISLNDDKHLIDSQIHGHHIIPLSYILTKVWKTFVELQCKAFSEESIQFRNLRFKNNVKIHPTKLSNGYYMIQSGSGIFECIVDDEIILTGQIELLLDNTLISKRKSSLTLDNKIDDFQGSLPSHEIYDTLEKNGFKLKKNFKNIKSCEVYKNNIQGYVQWENDWIYFLEGLMKFPILAKIKTGTTEAPVSIRQISINPAMFEHITEKRVFVDYNIVTNEITCNGIKISELINAPISNPRSAVVKLEEQGFVHFDDSNCENIDYFISDAMDLIMEADKLGLNNTRAKLIMCSPYYYDDAISKDCTKAIQRIIKKQIIDNKTMDWDNVKNPSEDDETGTFITFTNINYLQDTVMSLANKKCSYIIVSSRHKLQDLKEWKTVTQQKLNDGIYLVLMKKTTPLNRETVFIKHSFDDNDHKIWKALKNTEGIIYIISKSEPLEGIKSMLMKYKTQRLRFLFILDSNAPDFETNKSFYTDRLSIGLIVNIYKFGGWSTYKRIAVQNLKPITEVSENLIFNNLSADNQQNLKIKHIGLNFNDLVVEDNTENLFGPLEYSGVMANDKNVMGITTFNSFYSQSHRDMAFTWPVPSTWTLEEATSVPLSYALSYYVFNVLYSLQSNKSVLVTSGLHAIGQAAISICLAEKCEIYAVVDSNHQADQLSHTFPELPRSRIVINTNSKFDIKLKMLKPQGFDLILNFLSGKSFQSAFNSTALAGKFFQFSRSDLKNQSTMGTRLFLKNISLIMVSANQLLNECDDNKRIVQQAFLNGLNKGVIKPFGSHIITSFGSKNIFDTMRTSLALSVPKKVVLKFNYDFKNTKSLDNNGGETYLCKPKHVYVIIGNKSDWLDICEWLVDRGAKKIVISVNRYLMSTSSCKRVDELISRNISVHIESDFNLRSKEAAQDWLNRLEPSHQLGSLFIVNQTDINKINNLRHAFENHSKKTSATSFICISSKGEHICSELKAIGYNALNISWNGISSKPNYTRYILPVLDMILQKSYNMESSTFVCSDPVTDELECGPQANDIITNSFPGSADELQLFNDKITSEAGYVEVPTKSPRLSEFKSVLPVFVIPGFKPKLIQTLYRQFLYPVFEAQIPDNFTSIDELSENLVNELKKITDRGYVSIIGESWGGIVALKMAQILEAQGTMVTVTLLEGDPEILTDLAKNYLSNDHLANKLESFYRSFINEHSKDDQQHHEETLQNSYSRKIQYGNVISSALQTIRFRLQTLLDSKPLPNKLLSRVLIIRRERLNEFNRTDFDDYFNDRPLVHTIKDNDYNHTLIDKKVVEVVTKNMIYSYSPGVEMSLAEKYRKFHFIIQRAIHD